MGWRRYVPELLRRAPEREVVARYRVAPPAQVGDVENALSACGVPWQAVAPDRYLLRLPARTAVWGLITREVDEQVLVQVAATASGAEVEVRCLPSGVHNAHATGAAGGLVMAATVWIALGADRGLAAALTTLLALTVWTDITRTLSLTAFERRITRLAEDLGTALWPGRPARMDTS